jgi:hypothetical protein
MTRLEITHAIRGYTHCIPSAVIRDGDTQYFCSNLVAVYHIRRRLGIDKFDETNFYKFDPYKWTGDRLQLATLLTACDLAKAQCAKAKKIYGWSVNWSDSDLVYEVHQDNM